MTKQQRRKINKIKRGITYTVASIMLIIMMAGFTKLAVNVLDEEVQMQGNNSKEFLESLNN